jgi:hypothetical protein
MPNLITNGVFETNTATGASQAPAGWTATSGSPDLQSDGSFEWASFGWMPADLDASDGGGYVSIYSSGTFNEGFATTLNAPVQAGVAYTFSFDFYVNDSDGTTNQPGATELIVTIGSQTLTIPIDSTGQTAPYWQTASFSFTATDTTSDFGISTSSDPGALNLTGIALDNLALEPVPDFIVEGTGGADLIDIDYEGDPEGDRIDAGDNATGNEDDSVEAGAGNDTVFAGAGNDTVLGEGGDDSIFGGDGDDDLRGGGGTDTLFGEAGDDILRGGGGADSLEGGAGNDDLRGQAGTDTLIGGAGNDTLAGGADDDVLFGDGGGGGRWAYEVYTQDFTSANGQAFTIESGTLAGSGTQDTLDIDALGQAATGQTNPEDFGVIFTSTLFAPEAGTYRFTTTSDDGSTIRILDSAGNALNFTNQTGNDGPFLDNDFHQAPTTRWGDVTLDAGQTYTIEVRVWENAGGQVLSGTVTPPGGVAEDLGTSDLVIGPEGEAGDDLLDGGAGSDLVFGGGGNDTILADQGDTLVGGDGDDLFILQDFAAPGAAITLTGGEGGETGGDTLQLTADIGRDDITFTNTDDAAGGLSGSFTVNGTLVTFSEIENIICFTPGARILTPQGERPVESLRAGDMVVTRDHGPQPLRWTGRRTVPGTGRFAPIRVAPHVLDGARAPLTVSPQHRFLFTGYKAELMFGCDEVLVAAKHLVDGLSVVETPCAAVTYIHLMFDRHEVIHAEGAATESFHAGDIGLSAIEDGAREELFALFPELRSHPERYGPTARPCLRRHEARLLMPAA